MHFFLGWRDIKCAFSCPSNKFGANCTEDCTCLNDGSCDPQSGQCTCGSGHFGEKCEKTCAPGYHGLTCESRCACVGPHVEGCNPETGECICKPGFRGIYLVFVFFFLLLYKLLI